MIKSKRNNGPLLQHTVHIDSIPGILAFLAKKFKMGHFKLSHPTYGEMKPSHTFGFNFYGIKKDCPNDPHLWTIS
jgi:hypothetical protein